MAYSKKQIEDIFSDILNHISEGHSLRHALRRDGMPDKNTFYIWLQDKDKSVQYARACDERAAVMFEDMLDIADSTDEDEIVLSDGRTQTNHHKINRDRLRVDTRKWALSKMMPKKYSDKHMVDVTSADEKIEMPVINFVRSKDSE